MVLYVTGGIGTSSTLMSQVQPEVQTQLLQTSVFQPLDPTAVSGRQQQPTYAGGFPEDYSDVFGAPAAALPAF